MSGLSESQILHFLIQITLLIGTARLLADVFKRFGQAPVIGELLSGLILGSSVLGRLLPHVHQVIFPADPVGAHLLEAFAWIGMIFLLLSTGIETDLEVLRGLGRPATLVSGLGVIVPLIGGFALGQYVPDSYLAHPTQRGIFSMFIAVAMAISAVPVIARILIDLDIMQRELGLVILAAGVIDDLVGWLLLSIIAGLAARAQIQFQAIGLTMVATAAFIAFAYLWGFRLISYILRWVDDRGIVEAGALTVIIVLGFACAIITQAIGVHAVFGAFVGGLMIGRSPRLRRNDRETIASVASGFLAPVFFAYSGLQTDIFALHGLGVLGLVLAVATLGKYLGCGIGGLIGGLAPMEALTVANGMNARGGMGIIVALLGLNLGVLTAPMYTVLILTAVVTSLVAPTLLGWSILHIPRRAGERDRAEHERIIARVPFVKDGAKLLVLDGGGPNTELATHLAAALGNHPDASISIFHADVNEKAGGDDGNGPAERFTYLKGIAETCGATNVYQRRGAGSPLSDLLLKEARRGYDAIFAGASLQLPGEQALGGVLGDLLREAPAPIVITRFGPHSAPFKRILAPTNGALYSTLGVVMAMYYANAAHSKVTGMYIVEDPLWPYRALRRAADDAAGREIIDEVNAIASHLGLDVQTRIGAGVRPEEVIAGAIEQDGFDLLVMGVLYRSFEQRLYFGPKVDRLLRRVKCAVAVVVFPETGFGQ